MASGATRTSVLCARVFPCLASRITWFARSLTCATTYTAEVAAREHAEAADEASRVDSATAAKALREALREQGRAEAEGDDPVPVLAPPTVVTTEPKPLNWRFPSKMCCAQMYMLSLSCVVCHVVD